MKTLIFEINRLPQVWKDSKKSEMWLDCRTSGVEILEVTGCLSWFTCTYSNHRDTLSNKLKSLRICEISYKGPERIQQEEL